MLEASDTVTTDAFGGMCVCCADALEGAGVEPAQAVASFGAAAGESSERISRASCASACCESRSRARAVGLAVGERETAAECTGLSFDERAVAGLRPVRAAEEATEEEEEELCCWWEEDGRS